MISLQTALLYAGFLVLCGLVGVAYGFLGDVSARRGVASAERGGRVTVPVLVGSGEGQHRGRAYVDGDDLVVIGAGTHLRVSREAYRAAGERRITANDEWVEFAEQRGFVDASGQRHLLGPVEEWADALTPQLEGAPGAPAGALRRYAAALPFTPLLITVACLVAFAAFQGVWAMGRDVDATVVRLVDSSEEGFTDCGVRWPNTDAGGRGDQGNYAEIDCYEPYPAVGAAVRIRALATPFDGKALDQEGTYEGLSSITGGPALLALLVTIGVAVTRLRRPAIRLMARPAPSVAFTPSRPDVAPVEVAADADLLTLLEALALTEGWDDGEGATPPEQPAYAPLLMAVGASRWWLALALAAAGFLIEDLPQPLTYGLWAGAAVAVGWALFVAVGAFLTIRRGTVGPVTSEWDYRLVRTVDDEWCALLVLGRAPQWMVFLDGPQHPPPVGRCGVRGDLVEGGAIQLRIHDAFWPTVSPAMRVDDEVLGDIREDVRERLRDASRP